MALDHITFQQNSQHGIILRNALQQLEGGLKNLNETIGTMKHMMTGDGSQAAHFTYMTAKYGFTTDALAKAAWDELNSLASKLNVNTSVTDVNAALVQAFDKFR